MNSSIFMLIIALCIITFIMLHSKRKAVTLRRIMERRKREGSREMKELAERFIEKECIINSFDSYHQYVGTIKEVTQGAILIENGGKLEAINLDFIIRIREYPKNKNGKKKSIVLD